MYSPTSSSPPAGDVLAQHLQLGADRAAFGLPLGGHPCVEGDLHRWPPHRGGPALQRGGGFEQELEAGGQRADPLVGVGIPRAAAPRRAAPRRTPAR